MSDHDAEHPDFLEPGRLSGYADDIESRVQRTPASEVRRRGAQRRTRRHVLVGTGAAAAVLAVGAVTYSMLPRTTAHPVPPAISTVSPNPTAPLSTRPTSASSGPTASASEQTSTTPVSTSSRSSASSTVTASSPTSMSASDLPRVSTSVLLGAQEMGGYPAVDDQGKPVPEDSTTPSAIQATTCGAAPYGPYQGMRERLFPNYGEGPTAHQVVLRFASVDAASAQFDRIRAHLVACPQGKSAVVATPAIGAAPNGVAPWRAVAFHAVTSGKPYSNAQEVLLVQANNRVEIAVWSGVDAADRTLANAHFDGHLPTVGPLVARKLAS